MYLPDHIIENYILRGQLITDPNTVPVNKRRTPQQILRDLIRSKDGPMGAIQAASIDCQVGDHFKVVKLHGAQDHVDIREPLDYEDIYIDFPIVGGNIDFDAVEGDEATLKEDEKGTYFNLYPGQFALGTTLQYLKIPTNIISRAEGRSGIARRGLVVESAGWVDPGFEGCITLELYNQLIQPIRIYPGTHLCQITFAMLLDHVRYPYGTKGNKYQGQTTTVGSLMDHEGRGTELKKKSTRKKGTKKKSARKKAKTPK